LVARPGAHALYRAAKIVIKGSTCIGIIAQAFELISDAQGFGNRGEELSPVFMTAADPASEPGLGEVPARGSRRAGAS